MRNAARSLGGDPIRELPQGMFPATAAIVSRLRSPRAGHPQRTPKDSLFSIYGLVRIEYFQ